jgi:hypothetical protein
MNRPSEFADESPLVFRLKTGQREDLLRVVKKLHLSMSEVARMCLDVGLTQIEKLEIPGRDTRGKDLNT